jgi:hypothetical protein
MKCAARYSFIPAIKNPPVVIKQQEDQLDE